MRNHFALVLVLLAVGCQTGDSSSEAQDVPALQREAVVEPRRCDGPAGSPTDVDHEPPWRSHADYRAWTTADGCLLRIDVLADRQGPEHCGFEDARVIITGPALGTPYTSDQDDLTYVRDPDGVFGRPEIAAAFDPAATLPDGAVDSGYREGGSQLWTVPDDPSSIYLVTADATERWPLAANTPLCA